MSIVYDIILAVIFISVVARGWRTGVLATLILLVGWGAAAFVISQWQSAGSLLILLAVLIGARLLAKMTTRRHRGLLGRANQLLGAALGIFEGWAVCFIYALVLSLLAELVTASWLSPQIISGTFLVSRLLL